MASNSKFEPEIKVLIEKVSKLVLKFHWVIFIVNVDNLKYDVFFIWFSDSGQEQE